MHTIQIIIPLLAAGLAVAYPLYALLMRERSLANGVLLLALTATASLEIFDLLAMMHPLQMLFWKKWAFIAEGTLPFVWLLFSLIFARTGLRASSPLQRIYLAASLGISVVPLILPVNKLIYSPDFSSEPVLFLSHSGFAFYLALIIGLTLALVNLETTFANASGAKRWNIKFEIIGAGSLLAGFFVYYGHSFLYRTIAMDLSFIRSIVLLMAVILIGYSQSRSKDRVRIEVSRNLAYKSVVLLLVGVYLIGLGLLGEGMQYFDRSIERSLAIAVAVVGGTVLLILLFSESLKRKIQVLLSSHFYQNKYDYRAQWLQFTDRLSSARSGKELSAAIVDSYCETFGMACGVLFLRNESLNGYYLSAHHDMIGPLSFISQNEPIIQNLENNRSIVDVQSSHIAHGASLNVLLTENRVSFAIPISSSDMMIGFILAGQPLYKSETYTVEDNDLMNTIAHQAAAALLNLRLSEQLTQAREMEVLGKVSTFMIHDLKNHVHTLSLVLSNAREYITDPDFQQDMLASLENTAGRMNTLIGKFKNLTAKSTLHLQQADLLQLATQVADGISGPTLQVLGCSVYADVDREQIQNILINLILNAIDATGGNGPVWIETGADNARAYIRVKDEGCGISEDFLQQHLFSPFKTTKKSGLGVGLYQCRQIAESHNGKIEATSHVGKGTTFTVWLPLVKQ